MKTIDTRDLQELREELKQTILEDFLETFPQYEDMTDTYEDIRLEEEEIQDWKEYWIEDINHIEEINSIESEIGREFEYGCTLILEEDFEDYIEELLEDIGYIPKDFPRWIEIDWSATAENVKQDYSSLSYQDEEYLYRA